MQAKPHALPEVAIDLRRVVKTFRAPGGTIEALREIDMEVGAGETVALLGRNGAGKSTTLDTVLGLTAPDSGVATVFGGDPRAAVELGLVGWMPQAGDLIRDVGVRELLEMFAGLFTDPLDVEETIELVAIEAIARRRTHKLSGGEAQRVKLALALIGDPRLLVLDEPTVGMDVESRRAFWQTMRELAAQGRTVVFATHYLQEADRYADRVVLIADGRIVASGPANEIRARVGRRTIRATLPEVDLARLRALPGVVSGERIGSAVRLGCSDSDLAIRRLLAEHPQAQDIEIVSSALEDAFIELTAPSGQPGQKGAAAAVVA